jgi:glycosyltransferase involved in cell wall biosynthesis
VADGARGLRIGIDACSWSNVRGYGRFTRELTRAMVRSAPADSFTFYLDPASAGTFDIEAPNVEAVRVETRMGATEAARDGGSRRLRDMLALTRAVRQRRPEVLFFPSVYTYFPVPRGIRSVVCIHDAIPERFPRLVLPSLKARLLWKAKVRLALAQTTGVLTVSEHAAGQIAACFNLPRETISVAVEAPAAVYQPSESAADITAAAGRAGLPPGVDWFIYVGGFSKHKRIDSIVRCHAAVVQQLRSANPDNPDLVPHLLLVGPSELDSFHTDVDRVHRVVEETDVGDLVHWPGFVPDEELRHLHSGALALLMPSECEGFGLPAVEAAACGTPVVATTESPLPQLLEGGGFFVDPGDESALTTALASLATDRDERDRLGAVALERARALSWDKAAAATLRALEKAANRDR